jgi:hypothetical protein
MMKPTKTGPSKVDPENVQPITKDQLKDSDKAELEAHMWRTDKATREGGSEWEPIKILLEGDWNSDKTN